MSDDENIGSEPSFHSCASSDSVLDGPSLFGRPKSNDSLSRAEPLPQTAQPALTKKSKRRLVLDDDDNEDEDIESAKDQDLSPNTATAEIDGIRYVISFGCSSLDGKENEAENAIKDTNITKSGNVAPGVSEIDFDSEESDEEGQDPEQLPTQVTPPFPWKRHNQHWTITSPATSYRLPLNVGDTLYDYQREGVSFLLRIFESPLGGGVLADDMGMGKTNQTVAALATLLASNVIKNAIIITPLAVLDKWRDLVAKQVHPCPVFVLHGAKKDATWASFRGRGEQGVVLSTYETSQSKADTLSKVKWHLLIADEASKIKNFKSGMFKSLRAVAANSKRRVCITGTPFENSLAELWAVFDFACDGKLFGKFEKFHRIFAGRIERSQLRGASDRDRVLGTKLGHALSKAIQPYILRREKSILQAASLAAKQAASVEDLDTSPQRNEAASSHKQHAVDDVETLKASDAPTLRRVTFDVKKVDLIVWVNLSKVQRDVYKSFLDSEDVSRALNQTQSPLAALTVLKKICDDTRLVKQGSDSLQQDTSNKIKVLMALLKDVSVDAGHKVVVFSHSKAVLTYVQQAMDRQFRGEIKHLRVDGDMKVQDRMRVIKAFNRDEPVDELEDFEGKWDVLLLTMGVGALGIEVTGADRVVIFDPHWNPAVDDQAIDRAFRIGQKKHVVSYRLVTVGTVEEKMTRIQLRKAALARTILNQEAQRAYSSHDDLRDLFQLSEPDAPDLLLRLILETAELTLEQSVRNRLDGVSDNDLSEILSQVKAIGARLAGEDFEAELEVCRLVEQRVIAGCSDRTALFSLEDMAKLEEAVESMSMDEKQSTTKAVEDAMGWLSIKDKNKS